MYRVGYAMAASLSHKRTLIRCFSTGLANVQSAREIQSLALTPVGLWLCAGSLTLNEPPRDVFCSYTQAHVSNVHIQVRGVQCFPILTIMGK